jgi:predicted GIY-YIG superfamily endonuclease
MHSAQLRFWPDPQPLVDRLGAQFFRELPECPGVYLMEDGTERVLYVGKAKSLRHRLGSYRVANPERMARRTLRLLRLVQRVRWEELPDEASALRRESELLLALRPRFNRAGVWPGQLRYLAWRRQPNGVALTISAALTGRWEGIGPFRGGVIPLHHAVARLLWCRLYPERGISDLPVGWAHGGIPTSLLFVCEDTQRVDEVLVGLRQLARGTEPTQFCATIELAANPLGAACWEEDRDTITQILAAPEL